MLNAPGAERAVEAEPERQVHLRPAAGADVAEVDDLVLGSIRSSRAGPVPSSSRDRRCPRRTRVVAGHARRIDHHGAVHRVQRLDDQRLGERPLDLLAQAVGVADEEARREPRGEVERHGDVGDDLARQMLGPDRCERIERADPRRAVDEHLACGARITNVPCDAPVPTSAAHSAASALSAVREPMTTSMAEPDEPGADRPADDARAEHTDLHVNPLGPRAARPQASS